MSSASQPSTLEEISTEVSSIISMLTPLAELAFPAASVALSIGQKIIQGVIAEEPAAIALYNQIKSGTPATPAQLQEYATTYEAAYQKLNADINAKLATAT